MTRDSISSWFKDLQSRICLQLEHADGSGKFVIDEWTREAGGGGITRVMTNGAIIEKGGVNFSAVWGETPAQVRKTLEIPHADASGFYATGVSIVLHPRNPMVPIIHMNVRYFEMSNGIWWFGGGIDLTPHYINEENARFFHQKLKAACDKHDSSYYQKFKSWADEYFFIKHRNETRGIGGIFFDHLSGGDGSDKHARFEFVKTVGETFAPLYAELMKKNSELPFGDRERSWQLLRRGRYVEFNLVWDRGTKFGLETDGRTESILMSLPPTASWEYNYQPPSGSPEANTLALLKPGIEWV